MTQPVTCRTCEQQLGSAALIAQLRARVVELETAGRAEVRELAKALGESEYEGDQLRTQLQQAEADLEGLIAKVDGVRIWLRRNGLTDKHVRQHLMEQLDRVFHECPTVAYLQSRLTVTITQRDEAERQLEAVQRERDELLERWNTRFSVLCGNCGQRYRCPRDDDKHGLGRCGQKGEMT